MTWFFTSTISKVLSTFAISMLPIIELRGGLPYGLAQGLPYWLAITVSILGNMVPVPFIICFIEQIFVWMRKHMPKLDGFVTKMEKKAEKNRGTIEKYGYLGLIILVAIPLPGTGAWTGSLVAALMNLEPKKSFVCIFLGVLIAAVIVTIVYYAFGTLI